MLTINQPASMPLSPIDEQVIDILREASPATVAEIKQRVSPPRPISVVRATCVLLARRGAIWSLGGDLFADSHGADREARILSLLRAGPQDAPGLVRTLWPQLDPRQPAFDVALRFVRGALATLRGQGLVQAQDATWRTMR